MFSIKDSQLLNDSLIIILVLYPIVSMSTHANNNR